MRPQTREISSTVEIVVIDRDEHYYPSSTPEHRGNPLIEVFPPLGKQLIATHLLTSDVACTDEDRAQPPEERMRRLRRLFHFFRPFPWQVDFAMQMWDAICDAYQQWNPKKPAASVALRELFDGLSSRRLPKDVPPTLSQLPHCLTLIGTPGCGKTEVPLRILHKLSQGAVFKHLKHGHMYQCLYVWVEAPTTKTDKALALSVYDKLYERLAATGTAYPRVRTNASATQLGIECALIARKLNLGLLGIDEIQHWFKKKIGLDEDAISFLTTLIARAKCAVLVVGTWQAIPIFTAALRLGRRSVVPGSTYAWKLEPGPKFEMFLAQLFKKQYTQQQAVLDSDFVAAFYKGSQGIPDIAIKLMVFAQMVAIADGFEIISPEIVTFCAEEYMQLISPALKAMAGGAKETDPDIWDAEPDDPAEYADRLLTALVGKHTFSASKGEQGRIALDLKAAQAAQHMTDLGLGSPAQTQSVAQSLAEAHPAKSVAEIVAIAIQKSKARNPTPTTAPKKVPGVDRWHELLDPADLRRIIYQANRSERDVEAAIDDAGYLFHPAELEAP